MGWFSRNPSWERQDAERLYEGLVGGKKLGDITPERLRIPLASYRQYEEKDLLQRELTAFMALMVSADKDSHAELNPELVALAKRLRRAKPNGGRMSLRAISAELATQGFLNENGRPFAAASVKSMLA
jgi:hypothetical protein